jgi:hypothetical protein
MGVLMVVGPLKVAVSILLAICGVFTCIQPICGILLRVMTKLPRVSNEETKKITRVST